MLVQLQCLAHYSMHFSSVLAIPIRESSAGRHLLDSSSHIFTQYIKRKLTVMVFSKKREAWNQNLKEFQLSKLQVQIFARLMDRSCSSVST